MARQPRTQRLTVWLNSKLVGAFDRAASGAISFRYDNAWLAWPNAMPVSISLPLTGEVFRGQPVVNVFENLLPDAERVRRNVAARLGADGTDAFSLLAVAGRDCVGALQFLRDGDIPGPAGEVRGEPLGESEIAALIRRLRSDPLGLDPDDEDFRISIAGAQDKTALLKTGDVWKRPLGTTATTHILKPPIGVMPNGIDLNDSVQNEYLCLHICAGFGLPVAETTIEQFEDQLVLSVTRFDRQWTRDGRLLRLPQEDFCQALSVPSALKYQKDGGPGVLDMMGRLQESDTPAEDRRTLLRAQMIFWLIGATDGHAKNFSIAHRPGGGFVTTPLYDVLTAQPIVDSGQLRHNRFKLAMSVGNHNHYRIDIIQKRHFLETADAAGLPKGTVETLCNEIEAASPVVHETMAKLTGGIIPDELIDSVRQGIRSRLETLLLAV